jgi:hypothetical protein
MFIFPKEECRLKRKQPTNWESLRWKGKEIYLDLWEVKASKNVRKLQDEKNACLLSLANIIISME